MSNSNNRLLISFANFSDDSNNVINRAIQISENEKCVYVESVHLFVALIEYIDNNLGEDFLKKLDLTFEGLYGSYQIFVANGKINSDPEIDYNKQKNTQRSPFPFFAQGIGPINRFTNTIFNVIATAEAYSMHVDHEISPKVLFDILIENADGILVEFLKYIGIDIEQIKEVRTQQMDIPDELDGYIINLNKKVMENPKLVSHVDEYIEESIEILNRKLKCNPVFIGEAGVGKTTIAYELANRIVRGNVPVQLQDKVIFSVAGSLLTAGTMYRGQFEARMKTLIEFAKNPNVILFFDEIHNFVTLNSHSNSSESAGNMIKESLADGSIRVIGTTTLKEYHKFIESDGALDRRIQPVKVKEPSVDDTIDMINATKADYENFHNINISEYAINMAVRLSHRYMKDKFLPDKAYTILDQACARVKTKSEKDYIDDNDILHVISKITGVNINKLSVNEAKQLLSLESTIANRLIGQKDAVNKVCKAIRRSKAGVREENKPLASFLFVGPTGVGKTELCKVLSEEVAFGDTPLIKIDMSEFSEKYSTSKIIGTAPGYVGYGEGGQLTEKVKHNPYSIVLFDEIEKAHPDVFNIFLQLLDEGRMTDGEGQTVDFTNCIIVMTSNAGYGAELLGKGTLGFGVDTRTKEELEREKESIVTKELESTFRPEFLNRIDNIIVFDKLTEEQCKEVTKLQLDKLSNRVLEQGIKIVFDNSVIETITKNGYSDKYGARNIRREIQNTVEDIIADAILSNTIENGDIAIISYKNGQINIDKKISLIKEGAYEE